MDEGKRVDKHLNVTEEQVLKYLKENSSNKYVKVEQDIVVIEEDDALGKKDSNIG